MISAGAFLLLVVLLKLNMQFPENVMAHVEVVLRWVHIVAGIIWVGLLYFFNLVNVPLMKVCGTASEPSASARSWFS